MKDDDPVFNMVLQRLECRKCGANLPVVFPMDCGAFSKLCGDFDKQHKKCKNEVKKMKIKIEMPDSSLWEIDPKTVQESYKATPATVWAECDFFAQFATRYDAEKSK